MRGILSTETSDVKGLLERVQDYPGLVGRDLIKEVTSKIPYIWENGAPQPIAATRKIPAAGEIAPLYDRDDSGTLYGSGDKRSRVSSRPRVVVLDCGVKYSILRNLEKRGCEVFVFPATTSEEEILSLSPDGVLLSNGPGDPAALPYIVETVKNLLGKVPIFGICLGHQILGQAVGGRTAKLKFGHHGINQPVYDVKTKKVSITSQNHGFIVLPGSLPGNSVNFQENLNDKTSEGLSYPDTSAFSVQYHPEAAPGPHDASCLFDEYIRFIKRSL
jgi:carbamoyl-phosphate synthase small subunit